MLLVEREERQRRTLWLPSRAESGRKVGIERGFPQMVIVMPWQKRRASNKRLGWSLLKSGAPDPHWGGAGEDDERTMCGVHHIS